MIPTFQTAQAAERLHDLSAPLALPTDLYEDAKKASAQSEYRAVFAEILAEAAQGHAGAQRTIGELYEEGRDFPKDNDRAIRWYHLAAENGDAPTQLKLALAYSHGKLGMPRDEEEGARWCRLAAEQGHPHAQFILGLMYSLGKGVPAIATEAVRWYRLAAEQGHTAAQAHLGNSYAAGHGIPENAIVAYAWLSVAAAQGDEGASRVKQKVAEQMTNSQVAKAQELSREYWNLYVAPLLE
ncbi:MAG: tetratricopeptide repeat protein [Gammaproteobacteria bacterium]|nr:tetratricopeptide repeat protein [Gammaproteobacteria bacterium]